MMKVMAVLTALLVFAGLGASSAVLDNSTNIITVPVQVNIQNQTNAQTNNQTQSNNVTQTTTNANTNSVTNTIGALPDDTVGTDPVGTVLFSGNSLNLNGNLNIGVSLNNIVANPTNANTNNISVPVNITNNNPVNITNNNQQQQQQQQKQAIVKKLAKKHNVALW